MGEWVNGVYMRNPPANSGYQNWLGQKPTRAQALAQAGYGQSSEQIFQNMMSNWMKQGAAYGVTGQRTGGGGWTWSGGASDAAAGGGAAAANPYQSLLDRYESEQDAANKANETRYKEILADRQKMEDLIAQMGTQEKADIETRAGNMYSQGLQHVVSRGLSNSMAVPALLRSKAVYAATQRGQLEDRLRQARLGVMENTAQFKERREDEGPNEELYARLFESIANQGSTRVAGGGGGGGGGGSSRSSGQRTNNSTSRPRPWSPNWLMGQGMSYGDAMQTAGAAIPSDGQGGRQSSYINAPSNGNTVQVNPYQSLIDRYAKSVDWSKQSKEPPWGWRVL